MGKIFVLAKREMAAYFYSPAAYIVLALFLMASAFYFFMRIFIPGAEASLRPLFEMMAMAMTVAGPLLTMRLLSEEYRSGTIETLMTAPVSDTQVVVGKFLGVLAFYLVMLACTLVFLALIARYGQPDTGIALMGYLGMVLLGVTFLAVGMFTSAITSHQLMAAILGFAILGFFTILMQVVVEYGSGAWVFLAAKANTMTYFKDFARGTFDSRGLLMFLSMTGLFLFLSVKTLESRRWR